MGYAGFIFSSQTEKEKDMIIFFESNKFSGIHIIGFSEFDYKNSEFTFFNGESCEKFILLKETNIICSKIRVYAYSIISFQDTVFWLNAKKYVETQEMLKRNFLNQVILKERLLFLRKVFLKQ